MSKFSAKDALIHESISLPIEIKNKMVKDVLISFCFEDGSIHHIKPIDKVVKLLSNDVLLVISGRKPCIELKNWNFLDEEDVKI